MKFLLPLLLINAFATAAEDSHDLVSQIASNVPLTKPVEYTCSLVNLWTQERHPRQYPGTSAHWSPAVLVSHSDAYQLWANGSMATRGIEQVAEVCTS